MTDNDKQILSNKITRYAKNNCANFIIGECAIYGKCKIPIYFASDSKSNYYRCSYFEQSVLPSEPTLLDEYKRRYKEKSGMRSCKQCNESYVPTSDNQKFCIDCAIERRRERNRLQMKERRLNEAINKARK